jgi:hypothetical protein
MAKSPSKPPRSRPMRVLPRVPPPPAPVKPVFQDFEAKTGPGTNATLVEAQAILGAFDSATHVMRLEMVELVRAFAELRPEDRRTLLALATRFSRK